MRYLDTSISIPFCPALGPTPAQLVTGYKQYSFLMQFACFQSKVNLSTLILCVIRHRRGVAQNVCTDKKSTSHVPAAVNSGMPAAETAAAPSFFVQVFFTSDNIRTIS